MERITVTESNNKASKPQTDTAEFVPISPLQLWNNLISEKKVVNLIQQHTFAFNFTSAY